MRTLFLVVFVVGLSASPLSAQIRSTSTGGLWTESSTWEGGEVPDTSDHVILTSGTLVEIKPPAACRMLSIEDDATLRGENNVRLLVEETLINHGAVVGDNAVVQANGDILSTGTWEGLLLIGGDGPRSVNVPVHTGSVWVNDNVFLEGSNVLARLDAIDDRRGNLVLETGATLRFTTAPEVGYVPADVGFEFEPQFVNLGTIKVPNVPAQSNDVLVGAQMLAGFIEGAPPDSLLIETHAMQAHPRFAGSVRVWWRFAWSGETAASPPAFPSLSLNFDGDQIGNLAPTGGIADDLLLYHSSDSGRTWAPIPESENGIFVEDDGGGFVAVSNVPSHGDYVIASEQPPANARPSVTVRVMGREQIRVGGPPSRYRILYANTSDVPIGRTLVGVKTEGGVFIDSVIPSSSEGDDAESEDAWSVDLFSPAGDSTEAVLLASPLGPRESRSFTAHLRAVPVEDETGKRIAAPAVAGAIVMGIATGYLTDFFFHASEEFMADPCNQRGGIKDKFRTAFDRTDDNWNPFGNSESPWQAAAENGANELSSSGFIKRGFGVLNVVNNVSSAASTVANGTDRYERNTGRSIWDPVECEPPRRPDVPRDPKELDPVRSWDPNAKSGPDGKGDRNHISSLGRMPFTIQFENKAEATAPAYRIVIQDTLSDAFDPASVRLGETSHEGWKITRDGNVLTWEIEGIELPPNVNPPEGEGFVDFSVEPQAGLSSGTALANEAIITFDLNDPIITNVHVNTLDFKAPITTMEPLPATVSGERVTVRWNSVDPDSGSGVASSVVYVSTDGGPFEELAVTDSMSFEATLEPGHGYAFYALAADHVGNVEVGRPEPVETQLVATSAEEDTPFVFALYSNYPNPFNPSTTIRYSLARPVHVRLTVYDMLGRAVVTLLDEHQAPGHHKVEAALPHLASGLYVYRIEAGSFVDSHAMILLK